ncbi:MAG: transcriptional regulator, AraC family [Myxococcales bacterium]|nr:transcriptional regulator, AraC family [Myxococcales bacterium]
MINRSSERMELRVDRDAEALQRPRVYPSPALVFPLDTTIVSLRAAETRTRLDRSSFGVVPARLAHQIEPPPSGTTVVVTLIISDALRAATVRDYKPDVDARRLAEVVGSVRFLPRTRWVDELVQRYVFERSVCERRGSKAARFLEAELTKELFFLGCEQLDRRTRSSVLFEGDAVAARARAWIEEHLFEPFHIEELVRQCHVSESTVLRAFRREVGVSPLAYLRRRRLEESMQLLESGRYGVTEVAGRVGYDNPSAFAAAFRGQFGLSPSRARPAVPAAARLPAHGAPPVRRRRRGS